MSASDLQSYLDLVDWRRRVGDLYRLSGEDRLEVFRRERDHLFATHPQSPVAAENRAAFSGLSYFAGDPRYRLRCRLEPTDDDSELVIETGGPDGDIRYRRAGTFDFELEGHAGRLTVLSLIGYGGGLFVPFRDATSGSATYGGGRYLFDTVKNTDGLSLDVQAGSDEIVIDFNYAYNPSCVYDPHWACPLAPRENWLELPIEAGEKMYAP